MFVLTTHSARTKSGPHRKPLDAQTTWESFTQVGIIGFTWGAISQARLKPPLQAGVKAAMQTGVRWGRISASFAGGTAAAVLLLGRKDDDKWCQMVGAAIGGAAAATSVDQMASSAFSFVVFSFVIGTIMERQAAAEKS